MASRSPDAPPPRGRPRFGALADLGPAAQAVVPGAYAWLVTVAPIAFARGAPSAARAAAVLGLATLVVAPAIEGERPVLARVGSVWGLSIASAIVWLVAAGTATASRLETARAVAGMIGWALFALASAAPAPRRDPDAAGRIVAGSHLTPRSRVGLGDMAAVGLGVALAAFLQLLGWDAATPERLLLVRLVSVAAGVGVIGAATRLALARHAQSPVVSPARRLRAAFPWLALLVALLAAGVARVLLR